MRLFLLILVALACVITVPLSMRLAVSPNLYFSASDVPRSEAALVLGASVARGLPSPVLRKRADAAIELYTLGKVSKILVTGDNGALSHDEVTPVRKYLIDAGVAPEDIFLDHAGFDTYSSMYRARDVFAVDSIVIVTQDFHLPRALWIAEQLGLRATGLIAGDVQGSHTNYLREIPASIKALLDVMMRREPKFLGPVIPLSGDGRVTWY